MTEDSDYAQVTDLLAPADGTKEIVIEGKKLLIKKINVGELSDITKVSGESEFDQYIWLIYKGVVKPKLTIDQIRKMQHTTLLALTQAIQRYSELDKDSIEKLQNFLGTKP